MQKLTSTTSRLLGISESVPLPNPPTKAGNWKLVCSCFQPMTHTNIQGCGRIIWTWENQGTGGPAGPAGKE